MTLPALATDGGYEVYVSDPHYNIGFSVYYTQGASPTEYTLFYGLGNPYSFVNPTSFPLAFNITWYNWHLDMAFYDGDNSSWVTLINGTDFEHNPVIPYNHFTVIGSGISSDSNMTVYYGEVVPQTFPNLHFSGAAQIVSQYENLTNADSFSVGNLNVTNLEVCFDIKTPDRAKNYHAELSNVGGDGVFIDSQRNGITALRIALIGDSLNHFIAPQPTFQPLAWNITMYGNQVTVKYFDRESWLWITVHDFDNSQQSLNANLTVFEVNNATSPIYHPSYMIIYYGLAVQPQPSGGGGGGGGSNPTSTPKTGGGGGGGFSNSTLGKLVQNIQDALKSIPPWAIWGIIAVLIIVGVAGVFKGGKKRGGTPSRSFNIPQYGAGER